jgi:hypothetical protein
MRKFKGFSIKPLAGIRPVYVVMRNMQVWQDAEPTNFTSRGKREGMKVNIQTPLLMLEKVCSVLSVCF